MYTPEDTQVIALLDPYIHGAPIPNDNPGKDAYGVAYHCGSATCNNITLIYVLYGVKTCGDIGNDPTPGANQIIPIAGGVLCISVLR